LAYHCIYQIIIFHEFKYSLFQTGANIHNYDARNKHQHRQLVHRLDLARLLNYSQNYFEFDLINVQSLIKSTNSVTRRVSLSSSTPQNWVFLVNYGDLLLTAKALRSLVSDFERDSLQPFMRHRMKLKYSKFS
jgi:hypothetical protein